MFKRVASKFNFKNDIKNVEEPPINKPKRVADNEDYGQFVDIDIYYPENKRPKVLSKQATTSTSNLSDDISDKTIASIEEPVQFTDIRVHPNKGTKCDIDLTMLPDSHNSLSTCIKLPCNS